MGLPTGPLLVPRLPPMVRSDWAVPGSKSITNRALVLAALAEGRSVVENVLVSDDTAHMRACLESMGIGFADGGPGQLIIDGGRSRLHAPGRDLFVGNSGTTVRFLAAVAALVPGEVRLVGDAHMAARPIADLVDGLRALGVAVDCPTGCPPLTIHGGRFPGGRIPLRADRSSQYLTALLLVAAMGDSDLHIELQGDLVSKPYIDMTRRLVADFGGLIEEVPGGFRARRSAGYRPLGYRVEPDASAASYPFALAAVGHDLTVPGLGSRTLQGDHAFTALLVEMGAAVQTGAIQTRVQGGSVLCGIDCDMHHISDTVMTLAAIAPLAKGPTTIRNVANIRIKECDRLAAMVSELGKLGQAVEHGDDWLRIIPRQLRPATVHCHHDHRIAMSFAVLGAATGLVTIDDPACVAKTYPGFWGDLAALYPAKPW